MANRVAIAVSTAVSSGLYALASQSHGPAAVAEIAVATTAAWFGVYLAIPPESKKTSTRFRLRSAARAGHRPRLVGQNASKKTMALKGRVAERQTRTVPRPSVACHLENKLAATAMLCGLSTALAPPELTA